MGQYQQWLSAQEVDQRLKVEKETLETELLYLRDRITILEQSVPEVENVILQALQAHSQAQSVEGSSSGAQAQDEQSGLTRVELPLAQGAEGAPAFPTLYSQMERGADMLAFFDKR